jgi:hypothetical protein
MNVVAAIACKRWHFRQAVVRVDLPALWACNLMSIAGLEQVI